MTGDITGRAGFSRTKKPSASHPERVCYVPELSDAGYTRQGFLAMCNGQEEVATLRVSNAVDWQGPGNLD